jgi:hypothetical protein
MTTAASKSLEQRLYEAWREGHGIRLTISDIDELMIDDAISTRVSNTASTEAGFGEHGFARLGNPDLAPPWAKFVASFKESSE